MKSRLPCLGASSCALVAEASSPRESYVGLEGNPAASNAHRCSSNAHEAKMGRP